MQSTPTPSPDRAAPRRSTWLWLTALLLCTLLLRFGLLADYPAQSFPDTPTYVQAARDLVSGDYSVGLGRRTPGYPVVIALAGESQRNLLLLQQLGGVLCSLLLFYISLALTGRPALAFAVGLAHSLSMQQLFQESMLLSESIAAFGVTAAVAAALYALGRLRAGRRATAGLLFTGVMGAYALMVRPQYIYFVGMLPLLVAFAVSRWRPNRAAMAAAAWVTLPMVVAVLAWSALVQAKVGPFTLSTQSGFGLVNHVADDLEYAPDEFALVRGILLRTREVRMAEVGNSYNTIWYAWPEIRRVTGWTLPYTSQQMKAMSVEIIKRRPLQYARSVASAWIDYWTVPNFWQPEWIAPPLLSRTLVALWWVEHKLLRLANLAFVCLVALVALRPALRRRLNWDLALTTVAATVLLSSLLQALADQGSNSRYALPTQSLVVLALAVAWARWRRPAPAGTTAMTDKRA